MDPDPNQLEQVEMGIRYLCLSGKDIGQQGEAEQTSTFTRGFLQPGHNG